MMIPGRSILSMCSSASLAVDTNLNKFPFEMIDPVITLDEADKWDKLWSDLFLKGQKVQKETE